MAGLMPCMFSINISVVVERGDSLSRPLFTVLSQLLDPVPVLMSCSSFVGFVALAPFVVVL